MSNEINKACAFTGHRPQKFPWKFKEEDQRCVALKAVLSSQIEKMAAAGVTDFYSGMALGVDTWSASAVLELRERNPAIKLHCVLPCEGQEIKWTAPAQTHYRLILEQADSIEYVTRFYSKNCMLERNKRLVDYAGYLLAVYNGEWCGGTAATIRYAQKMNRRIILIDPLTQQITNGGERTL
ncbi:MAG: DUF1273 domain-containing protein [Oscillospiraceae bacterium]|nr:DUF1273 domain-containing protein [Oscillospiraceae bacterium]